MKRIQTLHFPKLLTFLVNLLCLTSASAALVYQYPMEEGSTDPYAGTTYCSTTSDSGTISGATWVTNGLASIPSPGTTAALEFDGTGAVTTTSGGILGNAPRSVTAWVKVGTQTAANPTLVGWGPNGLTGRRFDFRIIGGAGSWKLRVEITGSGVNGNTVIDDGNWHFVAVTHTGTSASLYVDGVLDVTAANSLNSTAATTATNILIGSSQADTGRHFVGGIDDVRVFDHVLTSGEIGALYLGAGVAPSITTLKNQSFVIGSTNSTVTFNPGILGTPPVQIQWKHNGIDLPGQTNDLLTISPAGIADLGFYTVAVTNAAGNTNATATLSLNTAPIIPPREAVLLGQAALFSVTQPDDSSSYTYQWRNNGVDIAGATAATLTLPGISANDAGTNYQVVVTLDGNAATSTPPAVLNALPVPSSSYAKFVQEDVPAGYWRLGEVNGSTVAVDQSDFYPGSYVNYTGGELEYPGAIVNDADTATLFSGANYLQIPFDLDLVNPNGLSLELWVKINGLGSKQSLIDCKGGLPLDGYELFIDTTGIPVFRTYSSINPAAPVWSDLSGSVLTVGMWHHLTATYDGAVKHLYLNGVLVGTQTAEYIPASGINLRCGAGIGAAGAITSPLSGEMDELAIYSKALSEDQVQVHYSIGSLGTGAPVTIHTQPADQKFILGDTNASASLSVGVSGSPRLYYQWRKGAANVPGGTNSTLTFFPATEGDIGAYSVAISNSVNSTSSDSATLSYRTGPISPVGLAVLSGSSATFTLVGMPNYQPYRYQWKHEGADIPNATNISLSLGPVDAADAGSYTVVATLGMDSAESDAATLKVLAPPTQTYGEVVAADAPVAWWRLNEPAGTYSVSDVIGLRSASSAYGDYYGDIAWAQEGALLGDSDAAVSFTGYSAGARVGNAKLDTLYDATLNPSVLSVEFWAMLAGEQAGSASPLTSRNVSTGVAKGYTFYVDSNGNWQFYLYDGTGSSILTGPTASVNEWAHIVGTYDGVTMRFYVNGALVGSMAAAYVPNDLYGLRIGAGASETLGGSFYWPGRVDEVAIYDHALSESQVQAHYAAAFPSAVTPRFTLQPRSLATIAGEFVALNVKAHSTPPVSYQWQHAGTNVPGATNATLLLNSAAATDEGSYQAVVTHDAASLISSAADLSVLSGQAVSVSIKGYENSRTIAANGGVAGYVAVPNWNEVGYNANSGSSSGLVNHKGQSSPITVEWEANNNRRWNGPYGTMSTDYALLNGQIEGTNSILVTVSNIPASFQSAVYSVYVYLGAPHATAGMVNSYDWFGAVSVAGHTNYYHSSDLATWDGAWLQATNTDVFDYYPSNANYAVFSNLTGDTAQIALSLHPANPAGPVTFSGLQIVADVAPVATNPTELRWSVSEDQLTLSWSEDHLGWTLQRQTRSLAEGLSNNWEDVPGTDTVTSTTVTVDPDAGAVFFRLRL